MACVSCSFEVNSKVRIACIPTCASCGEKINLPENTMSVYVGFSNEFHCFILEVSLNCPTCGYEFSQIAIPCEEYIPDKIIERLFGLTP